MIGASSNHKVVREPKAKHGPLHGSSLAAFASGFGAIEPQNPPVRCNRTATKSTSPWWNCPTCNRLRSSARCHGWRRQEPRERGYEAPRRTSRSGR